MNHNQIGVCLLKRTFRTREAGCFSCIKQSPADGKKKIWGLHWYFRGMKHLQTWAKRALQTQTAFVLLTTILRGRISPGNSESMLPLIALQVLICLLFVFFLPFAVKVISSLQNFRQKGCSAYAVSQLCYHRSSVLENLGLFHAISCHAVTSVVTAAESSSEVVLSVAAPPPKSSSITFTQYPASGTGTG